ncbi:acetyltransferase [Acidobacteria bacterium Mor1]|nr:acetyltransferase [Acidobacteria bacterium Mor1]
MSNAWAHPTAILEADVELGEGTKVWDNAHVRHGARIGKHCIVGDKSYIAYDVRIGDYCKLNTAVYVCAEVTLEDFCMVSAHVVFTNDRFPRAGNLELTGLASSDPDEHTLPTRVCRGTTIGANATIGPGLTLGEFSMIGMGAVVTRDVPAHGLVIGNPARQVGWVCACGEPLFRGGSATEETCGRCSRRYHRTDSGITEIDRERRAG